MPTDYFFAPRASGVTGRGTKDSPWSADLFESRMLALGAEAIGHLDAGIYPVRGCHGGNPYHATTNPGYRVQNSLYGQRGATIQIQNPPSGASGVWCVLGGASTAGLEHIEIEGVTLDCNRSSWAGQFPTLVANGVMLWGNHIRYRNLRVINAYADYATSAEGFACAIYAPNNTTSQGNVIAECEVASVLGDYVTGFVMGGLTSESYPCDGRIVGCRVLGTCSNAYTVGNMHSAAVRDCLSIGAAQGFYHDTEGGQELRLEGNRFLKPNRNGRNWTNCNGIIVTPNAGIPYRNLSIRHNTIELNAAEARAGGSDGLRLHTTAADIVGAEIHGNDFRWDSGYGTHSLGVLSTNAGRALYIASGGGFDLKNWNASNNRYAPDMTLVADGNSTAGWSAPTY